MNLLIRVFGCETAVNSTRVDRPQSIKLMLLLFYALVIVLSHVAYFRYLKSYTRPCYHRIIINTQRQHNQQQLRPTYWWKIAKFSYPIII